MVSPMERFTGMPAAGFTPSSAISAFVAGKSCSDAAGATAGAGFFGSGAAVGVTIGVVDGTGGGGATVVVVRGVVVAFTEVEADQSFHASSSPQASASNVKVVALPSAVVVCMTAAEVVAAGVVVGSRVVCSIDGAGGLWIVWGSSLSSADCCIGGAETSALKGSITTCPFGSALGKNHCVAVSKEGGLQICNQPLPASKAFTTEPHGAKDAAAWSRSLKFLLSVY
mmetsp:Transcript_144398/g.462667  ORF Transcript_144398/g.462667 Transcript_144398/m.462667 type:complete len:226 (-) Transcript_144398:1045-1722(-)